MLTWYLSKVKYKATVEGTIKTVTEEYLHQGVNYGDAETQHYSTLKTRMKAIDVDGLTKARYDDVVFYSGTSEEWKTDPFFSVVIDTGGEKTKYLVPASDPQQAIKRVLKAHGYGEAKDVKEIKETKLLGVWHPHNELWQGDWWNRMERLLEQKKCSWDINQTEMNFEKSADGDQSTKPDSTPPFKMPEPTEAESISAELAKRKATVPALVIEVHEAEDLQNGVDIAVDTLTPVGQLPKGKSSRKKSLPAPTPDDQETEPDDDDKHLEEYLANA